MKKQELLICDAYRSGIRLEKIRERFGVSNPKIYRILKRHNVPKRQPTNDGGLSRKKASKSVKESQKSDQEKKLQEERKEERKAERKAERKRIEELACRLYQEGWSVVEICEEVSRSKGLLYRILSKNNIPRDRGTKAKPKVKLMNSAMMPQSGKYKCKEITKKVFAKKLQEADFDNILESYVGYQQNIALIKEWTGVSVPLSRAQITLNYGDVMLIMRLNYRTASGEKGKSVSEEDFSFFEVSYTR